jgi:CRP-like cAMP-binding protein
VSPLYLKGEWKMLNPKEGWELRITEMDLFAGINPDIMSTIADICSEEHHTKGKQLFAEGDEATSLFILEEGTVELQISRETAVYGLEEGTAEFQISGHTPVYTLSEGGSLFGWSSLVETAKYTASAVCSTDMKAIRIDTRRLNRIFTANPDIGLTFYRRLSSLFNQRLAKIYQRFLSVK